MTSTHTGNPVCCAAALANIDYIIDNKLVEKSAKLGGALDERSGKLVEKYSSYIGNCKGKGLVRALIMVKKDTREIDPDLAHDIVRRCIEKGLLLFAPVGAGSTIKISPPLVITEDALMEGLDVLDEAIGEAIGK
jgi:4-aminobutyrate aminotransferase/diaminobutyrate-pyruvate transaminase/4-aminobutyrate aminotransferase/(S)-3-amino-2-methylpropionate transaminase